MSVFKRMVILILCVLITCVIINLLLLIPIPSLADNNAWLGFWGSIIGAIISGIITLWVIEYTIKTTLMNVKPVIVPIKSFYYIYSHKKDKGMHILDKKLSLKLTEYLDEKEIDFSIADKFLLLEAMYNTKENNDKKWSEDIDKIDSDLLYNDIVSICKYKTVNKAFNGLALELNNKYKGKYSESIINDIIYRLKQLYVKHSERDIIYDEGQWQIYFPIYNVGQGTALNIEISWSIKDLAYKTLCDGLGFDDSDYDKMKKHFSFDNMQTILTEILINDKDRNKLYIEVPREIIHLISFIKLKQEENIKNHKYVNNNILVNENKIAQINIKYDNIHGESFKDENYDVYFKIGNNIIDEYYNYDEEYFYFRFIKTKK